jgi:hypothetical protein
MRKVISVTAAAVALGSAAFADPITIPLGEGWQATIFDPDHVAILVADDNPEDGVLNIRKRATFVGLDPITNQPVPALVTFQQIASDAATAARIQIVDEALGNSTGLDWDAFRNILAPGANVSFNQALSATYSIAPFTTRTYNGSSSEVVYAGGIVPDGSTWIPGVPDGELVIDANLSAPGPIVFTLKEIPTPEPASLALLALGSVLLRRRS